LPGHRDQSPGASSRDGTGGGSQLAHWLYPQTSTQVGVHAWQATHHWRITPRLRIGPPKKL